MAGAIVLSVLELSSLTSDNTELTEILDKRGHLHKLERWHAYLLLAAHIISTKAIRRLGMQMGNRNAGLRSLSWLV